MSDFLKNLVGRSLGTLEVIQPRVPSMFEPYRRGSGLPGSGSDFHGPNARSRSAVDNDVEVEATSQSQTPDSRTQVPTPTGHAATREGREPVAEVQREGQAARMSEAAEPSRPVPPSLPKLPTSRTPAPALMSRVKPQPVEMSEADPLRSEPIRTRLNPTMVGSPSIPSGPKLILSEARSVNSGTTGTPFSDTTLGKPSLEADRAATRHDVLPHVVPGRVGEARRPTIGADRTPASPSVARDLEPITPLSVRRSVASALAAAQLAPIKSLPIGSAVRPPIAPRSEGVRHPESSSIPAPPAIDVTIGRVEVRAVFREPAPRPAPPARQRPTVSLDEYLNRRNGGKR